MSLQVVVDSEDMWFLLAEVTTLYYFIIFSLLLKKC